jgi:hypothetical protein
MSGLPVITPQQISLLRVLVEGHLAELETLASAAQAVGDQDNQTRWREEVTLWNRIWSLLDVGERKEDEQ